MHFLASFPVSPLWLRQPFAQGFDDGKTIFAVKATLVEEVEDIQRLLQ
jgi:hypothetical protein